MTQKNEIDMSDRRLDISGKVFAISMVIFSHIFLSYFAYIYMYQHGNLFVPVNHLINWLNGWGMLLVFIFSGIASYFFYEGISEKNKMWFLRIIVFLFFVFINALFFFPLLFISLK